MADFKPIRSLEENVSTISPQDGQLILTDKGNIYVDMPKDQRVFIRGASIPIVLTKEEYDLLRNNLGVEIEISTGEKIKFEPQRIYMIIQDDAQG